jgi:hypothetical protein
MNRYWTTGLAAAALFAASPAFAQVVIQDSDDDTPIVTPPTTVTNPAPGGAPGGPQGTVVPARTRLPRPGRGDVEINKVGGTHSLYVNGRPVQRDMQPRTIGGAVMVPVRFVAEYLGGSVHWEPRERRVRIENGKDEMTLNVGTTRATVNGFGRALRQSVVIRGGRTLLPLGEVARFFNAGVNYNAQTRTVFITTPGGSAGGGPQAGGANGVR